MGGEVPPQGRWASCLKEGGHPALQPKKCESRRLKSIGSFSSHRQMRARMPALHEEPQAMSPLKVMPSA